MGFFSSEFLARQRTQWMNTIKKFQYCAGGVWYDAVINSREVVGNSIVFMVAIPNDDSIPLTVTAVRILDSKGIVTGQQSVRIVRNETQSILVKFSFPIQEV